MEQTQEFQWLALLPSLVFMLIFMVPLAFGAGWLAPKFGGRRVLWFILCLIPGVNFVMLYVLMFRVMGAMLDKLNALEARLGK